jgi:hypothetical protein
MVMTILNMLLTPNAGISRSRNISKSQIQRNKKLKVKKTKLQEKLIEVVVNKGAEVCCGFYKFSLS